MSNKTIELHILQNFAPANLNRDDTNSPKDCMFGGTRRARISSQCIKRAIRLNPVFKDTILSANGDIAIRTRYLQSEFERLLEERGEDKTLARNIVEFIPKPKNENKSSEKSSYIYFIGKNEINLILDTFLAEQKDDVRKKAIEKIYRQSNALASDIALFGRMVAGDKMTKDAACQVAHAISINRINKETDYFTAIDDLSSQFQEDSGSGHIGNVDFNSSCFYRYSNINLAQLKKNLGDDSLIKATVTGFIESSIKSIPTGKQNSFAAQNPPFYIKIVIRDDGMLWSLTNAFIKPIDKDFSDKSIEKLEEEYNKLEKFYGINNIVITSEDSTLKEMLDKVSESI